ncbi:DNA-binding protein [Thalassospira profundimaris]|uniref:DNA-binding protein n=1 Tax=Thalassospira TaxID=168934 RepID=UPI000DEDD002|nr:DNA-binding protein [Thalassospira profundimaris]
MTDKTDSFDLTVQVPIEEWAYCQRRTTYLEAVLVQVLHDKNRIQEWYDAQELLDLRLPGMPASKAAITRLANARGWRRLDAKGLGGKRFKYHYSDLPARAFDALISRILAVPRSYDDVDVEVEILPEIEPAPEYFEPEEDNTAPPWVLPFMRILKGGAKGNIGKAWLSLPKHLPEGVPVPSKREVAETIVRLGLIKDG